MPYVETTCAQCNTPIRRYRQKGREQQKSYCSTVCQHLGHRSRTYEDRICEQCGTTFAFYTKHTRIGQGRFCSDICRNIGHRSTPEHQEIVKARTRAKATHNMKLYREKDPEKFRKRNAAYREAHRKELALKAVPYTLQRRARLAGAPTNDLSTAQWEEIKLAFHHCCAYCEQPTKHLEVDHLTPLRHGGSHTLHNVVPACRSCNAKKHARGVLVPVQPLLLTVASKRNRKQP